MWLRTYGPGCVRQFRRSLGSGACGSALAAGQSAIAGYCPFGVACCRLVQCIQPGLVRCMLAEWEVDVAISTGIKANTQDYSTGGPSVPGSFGLLTVRARVYPPAPEAHRRTPPLCPGARGHTGIPRPTAGVCCSSYSPGHPDVNILGMGFALGVRYNNTGFAPSYPLNTVASPHVPCHTHALCVPPDAL